MDVVIQESLSADRVMVDQLGLGHGTHRLAHFDVRPVNLVIVSRFPVNGLIRHLASPWHSDLITAEIGPAQGLVNCERSRLGPLKPRNSIFDLTYKQGKMAIEINKSSIPQLRETAEG